MSPSKTIEHKSEVYRFERLGRKRTIVKQDESNIDDQKAVDNSVKKRSSSKYLPTLGNLENIIEPRRQVEDA